MKITPATTADLDTLAALHASSWRAAYRGIMRDAFLDGPLIDNRIADWTAKLATANVRQWGIFLARAGDDAIGFACAIPVRNSAWGAFLDNLHLAPDARGQGIGRTLMAAVARWALDRGDTGLHLLVYEPNAAARRFYARHGGTEVERIAVPSPDGTVIPEIRVAWNDVRCLLPDR